MFEFDYTAKTADDEAVQGRISAQDEAVARASLETRGWTVIALSRVQDSGRPSPPARLSRAEVGELTQTVSDVCSNDHQVIEGFRAAALETSHVRLAQTFHAFADQLEAGKSLTQLLEEHSLPAHLLGLVKSAARTGKLGFALTELLECQRATRELKRAVTLDLAYPVVVACLATLVFTFMGLYVVPIFREMFLEFGMTLPWNTLVLLWLSAVLVKGFVIIAPPLFVLLMIFRVMAGDSLSGRAVGPVCGCDLEMVCHCRFLPHLRCLAEIRRAPVGSDPADERFGGGCQDAADGPTARSGPGIWRVAERFISQTLVHAPVVCAFHCMGRDGEFVRGIL